MKTRIAATVAGLALTATGALAAPAQALPAPGAFQAQFHGTCTNNYVAFWRVAADDPQAFEPLQVDVDVKYQPVKSELMWPGDYDEVHRYFTANGVPKTVQVFVDGVLFAERTYSCGLYAKRHHR